MLKLMTVFLGCVHAIPGADAEFFFGPSPAMTCMDALMPRAQDAQERPLAGRSASMK